MSPHSPALFVAVTMTVLVVPGPSVAFAVSSTLRHGRLTGLCAVAGLETGMLVHVLAASVGLSTVVASSPSALTAVRVAGASYLAYLGLSGLRAERRRPRHARVRAQAPGGRGIRTRVYRAGILVDVLNPKSFLFFVALLPPFVDPGSGGVGAHPLTLGAVVVVLATVCDGAWALGADLVRRRRTRRPSRWVARAPSAALLALAGITLAT